MMSPARAGAVWLEPELEQLRREFAGGVQLREMMAAHERTAWAILTKLQHLGLLDARYHPILQDPWITKYDLDSILKGKT